MNPLTFPRFFFFLVALMGAGVEVRSEEGFLVSVGIVRGEQGRGDCPERFLLASSASDMSSRFFS